MKLLILKKFNKYILLVIPLTSRNKINKYYHKTKYRGETYSIILSQLRTISSKRLSRKIRRFPEAEFEEVKTKIKDFPNEFTGVEIRLKREYGNLFALAP